MADLIVAPGVCRYYVNQTYRDRRVVNIIDLVVNDTVGPTSRDEAVNSAAGDVLDAWDQYIRGGQSELLRCDTVSWVDLNSEDGSTGEISSTADTTWPAFGGALGQALPSNVAILVTKQTSSRRGSRNGRMFVAGLTEQNCVGNLIEGGFLSTITADYGDFTEALTETGVIADYQTFPTVVHTRNVGTPSAPVIEYVDNTQITSFSPQATVATQRRRLRG